MSNTPKTWSEARRLALKQAREMTDEEDARITQQIAADSDTFELDETWFTKAKPARGRPRKSASELLKSSGLRLKPETVAGYKKVVGEHGVHKEMRKGVEQHLEELVAQQAQQARSLQTTSASGARKGRAKTAARASRSRPAKSGKRR